MALVIARHLRFAWLEYHDSRDAVAFGRSFSTTLGWSNLFSDLVNDPPKGVIDVSNQTPVLKIHWTSDPARPHEKALVAFPEGAHNEFVQNWLTNPGVNRDTHILTSNNATSYADLLALSGHGGGGMVWGPGTGKIRVSDAYVLDTSPPAVTQTRYLLLPTCGNCGDFVASLWLPAFRRPDPLHGILGYAEQYNGGGMGAAIMRKWAHVMRSSPKSTILETWVKANAGYDWGALMHENSAKEDTVQKWHSAAGLDKVDNQKPVLHFDNSNYPTGRPVTEIVPDVDVRFVAADGTDITRHNNSPLHEPASHRRHLREGQPGWLRIVPKTPLAVGDQVAMIFYWVRREKPYMDLDALLDFPSDYLDDHPSLGFPRLVKIVDANPKKGGATGKADGLRYTVISGEELGTLIPFIVRANARSAFKDIENGSHGSFWMDVYPPSGKKMHMTGVNMAYLV